MIYAPADLTQVSQQRIGATDQTCLGEAVCVGPDVLTAGVALVGTLAFAIALALALSRLHDATEMLAVERDRTKRERDAFQTFLERVASMSPRNPRLTDGGHSTIGGRSADGLVGVIDAYRETVLSLDHYEEEYDDTLLEHMTAEFGEDVALAVHSSVVLSPQLQQTLCTRAQEAMDRRERLLEALDAERSSLGDCKETLASIDEDLTAVEDRHVEPTGETLSSADSSGSTKPSGSTKSSASTIADWHRINDAEGDVRDLLDARQTAIHDQRHVIGKGDGPTALYEYVYDDLPTSYPILSVGTRFLDRASSLRRTVARALVKQ